MKKIFKKNQVIITALAIMIAVAGYINYSDNHLGIDKTLKKASTSTADDKSKETADADGIVEDIDSLDYDLTDESALLEENAAAENGDTNTQDQNAAQDQSSSSTDGTTTGEDGNTTDNNADSKDASAETPGEAVLTGASNFVVQAKVSREQVRSANKETLLEIINNENIGDEQKQEAIASMVRMTDLAEQEEAAELLLDAKGSENVVVNLTNDLDVELPPVSMADDKRAQIEDIVKRKTSVPVENIVITPMDDGSSDGE